MRKIMPAIIVTAATVAAVAAYIKKRIDKQNKVNFIEVDIKPKKTIEKVFDAAGNIAHAGKEILKETVDTASDTLKAINENPADLTKVFDQIKENAQEIISAPKDDDLEIEKEENEPELVDETENNEIESDNTVEQALLINSIVADLISEEEKMINEAITMEIEKIIDEVIEEEKEEVTELFVENITEEEPTEEISVDEIMEEVALQAAQQEHIEEVLSATIDGVPLAPLDLQSTDETTLKVVDETVGEINLINDIIESLDEEDPVQESIEDLEDIVDTAIYQEPVVVDEALLTEEQFAERCLDLYPSIKENKINLIIKQVKVMLETIEVADSINLQHFAVFASVEDKERYANIAAIEGHHVLHSDNENELIILNTLDSDYIFLCKSILQLAQDLTEYNGLYKGWTVS